MKFRSFGQAGLCSLALAPLLGASVGGFGDSVWSMFIGLAVILAATGIFIAAQWFRSRRTFRNAQKSGTDKISTNLVLLSSAAVLAIYSAGYFRTESAARQFAEQAAVTETAAAEAPSSAAPPVAGSPTPATAPSAPRRAGARLPGTPNGRAASASSSSASSSAPSVPPAPPVSSAPTPPPRQDSRASSDSSPATAASESAPPAQTAEAQSAAAPAAPEFIPYKNGTYTGWGYCRHGDIQAQVVVQGGKIVSAEITQCLTRYPCSVIKEAPGQVVSRQSATVDLVSGATQSGYAFHDAVAQALSKAE